MTKDYRQRGIPAMSTLSSMNLVCVHILFANLEHTLSPRGHCPSLQGFAVQLALYLSLKSHPTILSGQLLYG
jgi:hypothetical protein